MVQRIEVKGKDGQNSTVDVTSLIFAAHASAPLRVCAPVRAF